MSAEIREITAQDALWAALTEHLQRIKLTRYALVDGAAKPDTYYFGVCVDKEVIGHIVICRQPMIVPGSSLTQNKDIPLKRHRQALMETFVETFAVEKAYQRQGYGRALQQAALNRTTQLGCYQMRSWSSAEKHANYALKLSMAFAAFPALYPMPGVQPISGVYFVKVVADVSPTRDIESKNATSS